MPPPIAIIKDMAAVASRREKDAADMYASRIPIGEAPKEGEDFPPMDVDQRVAMGQRLFTGIGLLMDEAEADHLANCKIPGTIPGTETVNPDYITRLSTNEFFFYTQEPLTLAEFEQLQNDIAKKVKLMPPGVQLILGSFAVMTADNQVMNVTPHITCGSNPPNPSFQLIVKNHTSSIDVRYKNKADLTSIESLKVLDVTTATSGSSDLNIPITINGQKQYFTFNNVVPCRTPGGTPYVTIVEVCLDHHHGTAQVHLNEYLKKLLEEDPNCTISHVLISNIIEQLAEHCYGKVMHVDPKWSSRECKKNVMQTEAINEKHYFGNETVTFYLLDPEPCQLLKEVSIVKEVERLFVVLEKLKFGKHDEQMEQFIEEKRDLFDSAKTSDAIVPILNELASTVSMLEANTAVKYVKDIIEAISNHDEKMHSFWGGRSTLKSRAKEIASLMGAIPIDERCGFSLSQSSKRLLEVINSVVPHLKLEYKETKEDNSEEVTSSQNYIS